jgi:hypothetical protein
MSNPWCVTPELVTKHLTWLDSEGVERTFWIKIKRFLNVGEDRAVKTAGWKGVTGISQEGSGEAEIRMDWKSMGFSRALAYLVDWSLEDDKQNRMPLTLNTVTALHDELFQLIENAITAHVEAMDAEKKAKQAANVPVPTSA